MSGRRLRLVKACAVCGITFRVYTKTQLTCSHTCRAIRQSRINPQHFTMQAANRANRARFLERLKEELQGLTLFEAYRRGEQRGYLSAIQRARREERRRA